MALVLDKLRLGTREKKGQCYLSQSSKIVSCRGGEHGTLDNGEGRVIDTRIFVVIRTYQLKSERNFRSSDSMF